MKCKTVFGILGGGFLVSFLSCVFLFYWVLDGWVTISYLGDSQKSTSAALAQASGLLLHEWNGMPKKELIIKLKAEASRYRNEVLIKVDQEEDVVWFGDLRFEFERGGLKGIYY